MRLLSQARRLLVITLVLCIGSAGLPALGHSSTATLSGRILRTGSGAPLPGVTLKVALRPDSRIYESTRTDTKGAYSLPDLPSGTYDVAVQADEGVYVVGAPLTLQPGEQRQMTLSVRPTPPPQTASANPDGSAAAQDPSQPAEPKEPTEPKPAEPKEAEPPKEPAQPEAVKAEPPAKPKWYRSAWFGAAVVVGSALIIGVAASSQDEDETVSGSPSSN